ncbi:MAG: hypothetical protein ACREJC_08655, partial [Tepidisphaeraceae bacterium]
MPPLLLRSGRSDELRVSGIAVAVVALHFLSGLVWRAQGQSQPPSDRLLITTDTASTWNDGSTIVFVAQTPVTIETQDAVLSARSAVVWITPLAGSVLDQNSVQIALLGDAKVVQTRDSVIRSGEQILVSLTVRGSIRTTTETRNSRNLSDSELYRQALAIRPGERGAAPGVSLIQRPWLTPPVSAPPTTQPAPRPRPAEPVTFRAADVQTTQTADNKVAFVLSGGVVLLQHRAGGDFIELQADRAVVFTQLSSLRALGSRMEYATAEDAVQAAYLEGDVRIVYTPDRPGRGDQRLSADRVYYEFTTDRAILTQAVIHTVEPDRQIPLMVRA